MSNASSSSSSSSYTPFSFGAAPNPNYVVPMAPSEAKKYYSRLPGGALYNLEVCNDVGTTSRFFTYHGISYNDEEQPINGADEIFGEVMGNYNAANMSLAPPINNLIDQIINMPANSRTKDGLLSAIPLGLLVYMLRTRLTALGLNPDLHLRGLCVRGLVYKFQNTVDTVRSTDNNYINQEGREYDQDRIRVNVLECTMRDFPLNRIAFNEDPFAMHGGVDNVIRWSHYSIADFPQVEEGFEYLGSQSRLAYIEGVFPSRSSDGMAIEGSFPLTFDKYYSFVTRQQASHGSSAEYYVLGDGGHIVRLSNTYRQFSSSNTRAPAVIRTAGLKQVLFESFTSPLPSPFEQTYIFCPSGKDGNCFDSCVIYGLTHILGYENAEKTYFDILRKCIPPSFRKYQRGNLYKLCGEEERVFKAFKVKHINGYSTQLMGKIAKGVFDELRVRIAVYHGKIIQATQRYTLHNKIHLFESKKSKSISDMNFEMGDAPTLALFQVDDTGAIHISNSSSSSSSSSDGEDDDPLDFIKALKRKRGDIDTGEFIEDENSISLGKMLHVVLLIRPPVQFVQYRLRASNEDFYERKQISEAISSVMSVAFGMFYTRMKYWEDIRYENIHSLVEYQKERYGRSEVKTLIFNEGASFNNNSENISNASSSSSSSNSTSDRQSSYRWVEELKKKLDGKPAHYIFAYDLETVSNTRTLNHSEDCECCAVLDCFRVHKPNLTEEQGEYLEPNQNCQIPWSAQWVCVNLSDSGVYLEKKIEQGSYVNDYESSYTGPNSRIYSDYFINNPVTEYGGYVRGKCVEEMLLNIASFTHARKGISAFMYAHNGAHFDSYIVMQYQRFEIVKLLKTSRGLMSVTLNVPVSDIDYKANCKTYNYKKHDLNTPKIKITLRDTMLQVPGSLHRLCKGFNVPEEFRKLDFPIQMINYYNCYKNEVLELTKPYGENDVLALAYIITCINRLIADSPWQPASYNSLKPPICQFLTCMSFIRKSMNNHFTRCGVPKTLLPKAVDIPALRTWLIQATIGGRVNAYSKTYASPFFKQILDAYLVSDKEKLKELANQCIDSKMCMQVLDFTSLYPTAMAYCPMPIGEIYSLSPMQCLEAINSIHCEKCEELYELCPRHKVKYVAGHVDRFTNNDANDAIQLRPFAIVIVHNLQPPTDRSHDMNRCMMGRKLFNPNTMKPISLLYSLESIEEANERNDHKEILRPTQAYTNIDLYWFGRQGFTFDIVGGFGFGVDTVYNSFIEPAFKERIKAKRAGNRLLSDFMKLNYNGSFGVTTQQDISEACFMSDQLPPELLFSDPFQPELVKHLMKSSKAGLSGNSNGREKRSLLCTEELTGDAVYFPSEQGMFVKRKKEHLGEFFANQSPMQIGAAILAWARHIANLVMFQVPADEMTYTDTDSIAISESYCEGPLKHLINNRDDAPMGSLKNDLGEDNGTDPRVILSLIGTKKVKLHVTINREGNIKMFNTFKGLNVSINVGGVKLNPKYADLKTSLALLDVNLYNTTEPILVESWKRDLQHGVNISNHHQNLNPSTYLAEYKGVSLKRISSGIIERFIPLGSTEIPDYPINEYRFGKNGAKKTHAIDGEAHEIRMTKYENEIGEITKLKTFIQLYYGPSAYDEYHPGTAEYSHIIDTLKKV